MSDPEIKLPDKVAEAQAMAELYAPIATHSDAGATANVGGPSSKAVVDAVNALCDVLCAEDVYVGDTSEEALQFLGALITTPPVMVDKTVTENGTYNPVDDEADGYSSVEVNVSAPDVQITIQEYDTGTSEEFTGDYKHAKVYLATPALSQDSVTYWETSEDPITSAPVGSFIVVDYSTPPTGSYQLARILTVPAANEMQLDAVGSADQYKPVFPVTAGMDIMAIKVYWEEVG